MATALRKIVAGIGQATELASEIAATSKAPSAPSAPPGPELQGQAASAEAAEHLLNQAQRLKQLLAKFKVCQQDNLAAWTEFQAGALSAGAKKKYKNKTGKQ